MSRRNPTEAKTRAVIHMLWASMLRTLDDLDTMVENSGLPRGEIADLKTAIGNAVDAMSDAGPKAPPLCDLLAAGVLVS